MLVWVYYFFDEDIMAKWRDCVFRNREYRIREFGGDISVEIIPVVMNGRALSK